MSYFMGCITLVRCVLVLRCGSAGVVWYPDAGRLKPASGYHTTLQIGLCHKLITLQDRQCTQNVIMRRVYLTIVAVEKQ